MTDICYNFSWRDDMKESRELELKATITNADEGVKQQELSFIAGRNAKWYSHFGRQFGSFLQN